MKVKNISFKATKKEYEALETVKDIVCSLANTLVFKQLDWIDPEELYLWLEDLINATEIDEDNK